LKPHAADLLGIVMAVLRHDNEENAVICLRMVIELHKNYRSMPGLEDHVQPFFDFVAAMLARMEENVKYVDNATPVDTAVYFVFKRFDLRRIISWR
jgi:transformation/transcription domain-associated protein